VDLIRYVVKAVVLEGLSVREVAAAYGVSRSWVYECLARYRAEGDHGLHPRSRRSRSSPSRLAAELEDEIVALRKDRSCLRRALRGRGVHTGLSVSMVFSCACVTPASSSAGSTSSLEYHPWANGLAVEGHHHAVDLGIDDIDGV
jgi:transposase-like protein